MMERFIYRFSKSPYKSKLILKGGLMFSVWNISQSRPTRDIDFLGLTSNNPENIKTIIKNICRIDCIDDGVSYNKESIHCDKIQEQNEYSGIRATLATNIGKVEIKLQIDIGFGDI